MIEKTRGAAELSLALQPNNVWLNRLLALDLAIAKAILQILLKNWRDLPILLALVGIAIAAVAEFFRAVPPAYFPAVLAVLSALFGSLTARQPLRRIASLQGASAFAAYANDRKAGVQYVAVYFLLGLAGLSLLLLGVSWEARLWASTSFVAGGIASLAILPKLQKFRWSAKASHGQFGQLQLSRHRPTILAAGIALVVLATVAEQVLRYDGKPLTGMAVSVFAMVAILTTPVRYAIADFQRIVGFSVWQSTEYFLTRPFFGLLAGIAATAVMSNGFSLAVTAIVTFAVMIFRLLQIMVFRLYSQRSSEWVLTITISVIMLAGFAVPYILPILVVIIVLMLGNRAEKATWLMK